MHIPLRADAANITVPPTGKIAAALKANCSKCGIPQCGERSKHIPPEPLIAFCKAFHGMSDVDRAAYLSSAYKGQAKEGERAGQTHWHLLGHRVCLKRLQSLLQTGPNTWDKLIHQVPDIRRLHLMKLSVDKWNFSVHRVMLLHRMSRRATYECMPPCAEATKQLRKPIPAGIGHITMLEHIYWSVRILATPAKEKNETQVNS